MTRARASRLRRLEAGQGAGLEVWQEEEATPGNFRQVFPSPGGQVLRLQDVKVRPVARVVFVTYGEGRGTA